VHYYVIFILLWTIARRWGIGAFIKVSLLLTILTFAFTTPLPPEDLSSLTS
jgi:hypothetical protein